jgi:hypothetical protein
MGDEKELTWIEHVLVSAGQVRMSNDCKHKIVVLGNVEGVADYVWEIMHLTIGEKVLHTEMMFECNYPLVLKGTGVFRDESRVAVTWEEWNRRMFDSSAVSANPFCIRVDPDIYGNPV